MIDDILFADDVFLKDSDTLTAGLIDAYSFDGSNFDSTPFKMLQSGAYKIEGVTRDNSGAPLGSCIVYLKKFVDGRLYYIGSTVSDSITGEYIFYRNDTESNYVVTARKTGSPNVFDVTDFNLTPVI